LYLIAEIPYIAFRDAHGVNGADVEKQHIVFEQNRGPGTRTRYGR